jgi:hypothetical protein
MPALEGREVSVVRPNGTFIRCTAVCVEEVHGVPAVILTGLTVRDVPIGSEIRLLADGVDGPATQLFGAFAATAHGR